MRPELIVAGKEFRDHIKSKRFIVIFIILMALSIMSMAGGISEYHQSLEAYKTNAVQNQQQDWYKDQVASLRGQIDNAGANGLSAEEISLLKYQLDTLVNPTMPSVLVVFKTMNQYLVIIAAVLSVAMGFDLISREKEEGSLKSLLSHPVYRDSVINGKLLGSLAVLTVVTCSVFLLTIAILLFYGVIPGLDDLLRITAYFVLVLVYCGVFFAIATMTSTFAKTSAMSVMFTMGIVLALFMITYLSAPIAGAIVGPAPEDVPLASEDVGVVSVSPDHVADENEVEHYYETRSQIVEAINTISPIYDFDNKVSYAILYKASARPAPGSEAAYSAYRPPTLVDSLSYAWTNLLALLIELIVPLAASYVMFMRLDIR